MLEEIKKLYNIDYSIDPKIEKYSTGPLLNQAYRDSNTDLFKKIAKKADFEACFKQYFDNVRSNDISEQSYELLVLTFDMFEKYQMTISDEKLIHSMISASDYRSKLFIAEKIVAENKPELILSKEGARDFLCQSFKDFDWKINIDLLLAIPHFQSSIEKLNLSIIEVAFEKEAQDDNISHLHALIEKLHGLGYNIEKEKAQPLIEKYLDYYKREDNTLNVFLNMKSLCNLFKTIQKTHPESFLSSFLQDSMKKYKIKDEDDEKLLNDTLIEIEKNDLEFLCQNSNIASNVNKVKIKI